MINLGETNRLPKAVIWYQILGVMLPIFFISLILGKYFWPVFITLTIIFALPVLLPCFIKYKFFSFIVEQDKITTKSGMLSRRSQAVPFNKVQSIDDKQGFWMRLFGLSRIKIWTASPQQINFSNKGSDSEPDIRIILKVEDTDWLRNFILSKQS